MLTNVEVRDENASQKCERIDAWLVFRSDIDAKTVRHELHRLVNRGVLSCLKLTDVHRYVGNGSDSQACAHVAALLVFDPDVEVKTVQRELRGLINQGAFSPLKSIVVHRYSGRWRANPLREDGKFYCSLCGKGTVEYGVTNCGCASKRNWLNDGKCGICGGPPSMFFVHGFRCRMHEFKPYPSDAAFVGDNIVMTIPGLGKRRAVASVHSHGPLIVSDMDEFHQRMQLMNYNLEVAGEAK